MVEPWGCVSPIVHFHLQTFYTQPEVDPRVFQSSMRRSQGSLLCQHCLLLSSMLVLVSLSLIPFAVEGQDITVSY